MVVDLLVMIQDRLCPREFGRAARQEGTRAHHPQFLRGYFARHAIVDGQSNQMNSSVLQLDLETVACSDLAPGMRTLITLRQRMCAKQTIRQFDTRVSACTRPAKQQNHMNLA
jgi:hypothetical protein